MGSMRRVPEVPLNRNWRRKQREVLSQVKDPALGIWTKSEEMG